MKCPECGKEINADSKFCQFCGAKLNPPASEGKSKTLELRLGQEQIAYYFSKQTVSGFDSYPAVSVPEGVFAYAYTKNGKLELTPGYHEFVSLGAKGFLGTLKNHLIGEDNAPVALVKKNLFHLSFSYDSIELKSAFVEADTGLLCKVTDGQAFCESFLADSSSVDVETVAGKLEQIVKKQLSNTLYEKTPEELSDDKSIFQSILSRIKESVENVYPFISVVELDEFNVKNENYTLLKKSGENFDASSRQLELEKKAKELEYEKFRMQNELDQKYREAELQKFQSSNEVDRRYKEIQHENYISDSKREQEAEKLRLENESEIEKISLTHELETKRIQDSYSDERNEKKIQQDKAEMQAQMELLKEAMALRNERKNSDIDREMKLNQQRNEFELEKIRLQNEALKMQRDEQIRSMEEEAKLKEAESKSKDEKIQMMKDQNNDMKDILSDQMKTLSGKNDW